MIEGAFPAGGFPDDFARFQFEAAKCGAVFVTAAEAVDVLADRDGRRPVAEQVFGIPPDFFHALAILGYFQIGGSSLIGSCQQNTIADDDRPGGIDRFVNLCAEPVMKIFCSGFRIERDESVSEQAEDLSFAVNGGGDG